jgi:hypothetical protein
MRCDVAKIRQGILLPQQDVRKTAAQYFARPVSEDPEIMPLVIQAVEKYGWRESFSLLRTADSLRQTLETVRWIIEQLSGEWDAEDIRQDNYCTALSLILCYADVSLLPDDYDDIPFFPEELEWIPHERSEMSRWNANDAWQALLLFGEETSDLEESISVMRRARHLEEAVARIPELANKILDAFAGKCSRDEIDRLEWIQDSLIRILGRMKLKTAIPTLVGFLHDEDFWTQDAALESLYTIGTDDVTEAIAAEWSDAPPGFRRYAAEGMGYLRSDLSAQYCLDWLSTEKDDVARLTLANSLLNNFVEESIPIVRSMVRGGDLTPDENDLRLALVATATVMGASFPEYDQWYDQAVDDWKRFSFDSEMRILDNFIEGGDEEEYDPTLFEIMQEIAMERALAEPLIDDEPFHTKRKKVRRNDPCPCGSGLKYKKCCLDKESF